MPTKTTRRKPRKRPPTPHLPAAKDALSIAN